MPINETRLAEKRSAFTPKDFENFQPSEQSAWDAGFSLGYKAALTFTEKDVLEIEKLFAETDCFEAFLEQIGVVMLED